MLSGNASCIPTTTLRISDLATLFTGETYQPVLSVRNGIGNQQREIKKATAVEREPLQ